MNLTKAVLWHHSLINFLSMNMILLPRPYRRPRHCRQHSHRSAKYGVRGRIFGEVQSHHERRIEFQNSAVGKNRGKITLRQQNFSAQGLYPSKDKVIVDFATNLIYAVDPTPRASNATPTRFPTAINPSPQLLKILRTYIAKETHEGILEKKKNGHAYSYRSRNAIR